ncbi:cyclopropane-fatty-acyl-phospholipid synthase family protein [Saliniramus sp.]|uniref:cyclopropane-fatty-acyl-phospholipid synthase family protein n=1 Tax=Saliniramus sp. TaxID=2986772 RepID=UPI002B540271|nr:cyclopropane-fatty-acyl-phospholipid synthase family protein [Saliniramus sp.]HMB11999.1 cyclopropane-fatty-acyl-phospholipid synthase family protein [Saliniramus sp.]
MQDAAGEHDTDDEFITVTSDSLGDILHGLPFLLRKTLSIAAQLPVGTLDLTLPEGRRLRFAGAKAGPRARLVIHDTTCLRRFLIAGDVGFAEGYLQKEWDSPDLRALLLLFLANHMAGGQLTPGRPGLRVWQRIRHFLNRNSRRGSRRNIHAHYDLGNTFYERWLDPSMTYSSAIFAPGDNDLESAQRRKYARLAAETGIGPDDHVLEIGCGWGSFAEYAAREIGCRVTGLTISQEQYDHATQRIAQAGLSDQVTIAMRDYRDETARYDRIISIEMFEAVGEQYWQGFFEKMRTCLLPGGQAGLQLITIRDEAFAAYRKEMDFIRTYVFPGGMLPSPSIMRQLSQGSGLSIVSDAGFALDYAHTLSIWRERFEAAWKEIAPLGFDERFRRLWNYYLTYCEVGFATANIDVRQMVFAKPA